MTRFSWNDELRNTDSTGSKMAPLQRFVRVSVLTWCLKREIATYVTAETLMGLNAKIQGRINLQGH